MHDLSEKEEQNFWPGYLDALINVMLNLLFLVAIFAMGLVSLNLQSMSQMRQINSLNEQAEQVISSMNLEKSIRDAILKKIQTLNIAAMIANRKEVDLLRQSTLNPANTALQPAGTDLSAARSPTGVVEKIQPLPEAEAVIDPAAHKAALEDKRRKAEELELQITEILRMIAQEKLRMLALQQSRAQAPAEQVSEFRTASNAEASERSDRASKGSSVRDLLLLSAVVKPQAIWEFPPNDFFWGASKTLPTGFLTADKSAAWHLLGFVDPSSARVRREVFSRMQAVRDLMILNGFAKERIQLELRPMNDSSGLDEQTHRLIFMLPQS